MKLRLRGAVTTVLAGVFAMVACRPATNNGDPCDEGALGCACLERTKCEAGLECNSGVCIEPRSSHPSSAADTGLASTASASSGATNGTPTSSGGDPTPSATADVGGNGGTSSSSAGGADGNAGAAGSGGTAGSAGAADPAGAASSGGGMAPHSLGAVSVATGQPYDQAPDPATVAQFVGEPCSSLNESRSFEIGSYYWSIVLEAEAADCGDLYCVTNRFQGRASCPYGQTYDDIQSLPGDDPARCRTPEGKPVTVEIEPQLVNRRAEVAMVCSCRCAGDDPEGSYCSCPSGTECADILPEHLKGDFPPADWYCIPNGSAVSPTEPPGAACDRTAANCAGGGDNP